VIDNLQQGKSFGEDAGFVTSKIGASSLPRKSTDEETSDLAVKAVKNLIQTSDLATDQVQALVLVTQNGDGYGLPHTSALVHKKLGLSPHVAVFDIGLGCSGYVYGLTVIKGFLQASGLENGVLVTADPYSKVLNTNDRNTSLLFGDAATATWIGAYGKWDIAPPLYMTDGKLAHCLQVKDGLLEMNGRQIFNFAVKNVPDQIQAILQREGLRDADIDLYCLHQASAAVLEAVSRKLGAAKEKVIQDMDQTGNTISSSIPLLLEKHVQDKNRDKVVISGFGVGLSLATTILSKVR
jgi:3-oxoacyl-[acyl-carrier-protein] synthase-3